MEHKLLKDRTLRNYIPATIAARLSLGLLFKKYKTAAGLLQLCMALLQAARQYSDIFRNKKEGDRN